MIRSEVAGGIVIANGSVLVVNQRGHSWSLPRGHVEEGESKMDTAIREIFEETGICDLKLVRELGTYNLYRTAKYGKGDKDEMKTITMFLFKTDQEFPEPKDPQISKAVWVKKEDVLELLSRPEDKEFFLRFENNI